MTDIKDLGIPSLAPMDSSEIQSYINGRLQDPIMANSNRLFYRVIVAPTNKKGADFIDIQKAIDAVNAFGGGIVYITNGTYYITSNITMYSNVRLYGEDNQNTFIDGSTSNIKVNLTDLNNIYIKDLQFKNFRSTDGVIYGSGGNILKVENCVFTDNSANTGTGIDIYLSGSNVIVESCQSTNAGNFIYLNGGSTRKIISNNIVTTPYKEAFKGDSTGGAKALLQNNLVGNAIYPIFGGKFLYSRIISNLSTYSSATSTGYQGDFTTGSANVLISNNHFTGGGKGGIRISGGSSFQVNGNNIAGSGDTGIELTYSWVCQITGNRIEGANAKGIRMDNSNCNQISGNYINTSGANSLEIYNGSYNQVSGNFVSTSAGKALDISGASANSITGNTLSGNGSGNDAVLLQSSSGDNIITGNWTNGGSSGTTYGVKIDSGCNYNTVVGNRLRGNSGGYSDSGSVNTIASNT